MVIALLAVFLCLVEAHLPVAADGFNALQLCGRPTAELCRKSQMAQNILYRLLNGEPFGTALLQVCKFSCR